VKILVLTTSYPRDAADPAGRFVLDAVEHVQARDVEVEVVSPASFRHFGLAYGHGIVGNIRARPWLALLVPAFLWNFRRAATRVEADFVHAHWLAAGAVALTLRKPYVVQVWGTDVELARRVPWLVRPVLRRARLVVAASHSLADAARALGARDVRVVPSGVAIPDSVAAPEEPPHVVYVGRLSAEKGVLELVEAARGLPLKVVGDGPLRAHLEGRERVRLHGRVPHDAVPALLAGAHVLCQPSGLEPLGQSLLEGMAVGRPVVATRIGGPPELVPPDAGVLVDPLDVDALERALRAARALPVPNDAARAAAAAHDVRRQAERIEAILERAARGPRA
jgi:glycosyltransferase involved in cell wall biosynthesis